VQSEMRMVAPHARLCDVRDVRGLMGKCEGEGDGQVAHSPGTRHQLGVNSQTALRAEELFVTNRQAPILGVMQGCVLGWCDAWLHLVTVLHKKLNNDCFAPIASCNAVSFCGQ
jgi:hypothetical protein